MTRQKFDQILTEEGITSINMRNNIWRDMPKYIAPETLDEQNLRGAAKRFLDMFPVLCKQDKINKEETE